MTKISHSTLAKVLDGTSVPVCVFDAERRIAFCNEACSQLLSTPTSELLGRQGNYHATALPDPVQSAANSVCPPPDVYFGRRLRARVMVSADGGMADHWAEYIPLSDADDQVSAVLVLFDTLIDESTALEAQRQSAAAAHDWLARFRTTLPGLAELATLVGDLPPVVQARQQALLAATTEVDVLIQGTAGSDTRRLARAIAREANGADRPFTALPCADLTESLLESTLEWAARHAQASQRPTLLLEDVDQLHIPLQTYLSLALTKMQVVPRLLSTARRDVGEMARQDGFRQDLACRLSTLLIRLPALINRINDLPLLAQALVEQANAQGDKQLAGFENEALEQLLVYPWPGDVAELRDVVRAAHARAEGPRIAVADLPEVFRHAGEAQARPPVEDERIVLDEFLARIELELIERALRQTRGNKTKAAELLGMNRPRFYRRLVQLGLVTEFRPHDELADQ